jgi:hypothetical protein
MLKEKHNIMETECFYPGVNGREAHIRWVQQNELSVCEQLMPDKFPPHMLPATNVLVSCVGKHTVMNLPVPYVENYCTS